MGHKCYIVRPVLDFLSLIVDSFPLFSYSYTPIFRIDLRVICSRFALNVISHLHSITYKTLRLVLMRGQEG